MSGTADEFAFALALSADDPKIAKMVELHGDDGDAIAMVARIAQEGNAGDPTGAAGTLLGILQLVLGQHHKFCGAESRRWIQYVVPARPRATR